MSSSVVTSLTRLSTSNDEGRGRGDTCDRWHWPRVALDDADDSGNCGGDGDQQERKQHHAAFHELEGEQL